MRENGFSVVEMLVVCALLLVLAAVAVPNLRAYGVEAHLLGAGRMFKGEFQRARSIAIRTGTQTAIRFERGADGIEYYRTYVDGNHNGVLSSDIRVGIDRPLGEPRRLDGKAPGVRVGVNAGVPAIPPDRGKLETSDPIRFGRSDMLSFSPLGTATPGTFYLAGQGVQAAVRVTGGSARVRLMVCRGRDWRER